MFPLLILFSAMSRWFCSFFSPSSTFTKLLFLRQFLLCSERVVDVCSKDIYMNIIQVHITGKYLIRKNVEILFFFLFSPQTFKIIKYFTLISMVIEYECDGIPQTEKKYIAHKKPFIIIILFEAYQKITLYTAIIWKFLFMCE